MPFKGVSRLLIEDRPCERLTSVRRVAQMTDDADQRVQATCLRRITVGHIHTH